uniref:Secreted protein n=1 Tax=Aquila chrysaetos chrysaetos TaxID=223781 RepID=A0A663E7R1_AQUCH
MAWERVAMLCCRLFHLCICLYNSLHGALMHAAGHEELWMDWDSTYKFSQYGWRSIQYPRELCSPRHLLPRHDLNENLTGFRATTLSWNLLRSTQLLSPATQ